MKTSKQWWDEVKNDPEKLTGWLQRQCWGEFQAFKRITELAERFGNKTLKIIAGQEFTHYTWIKNYLDMKGIPTLESHTERYWKEVNLTFDNIEQAAAVGHHAEMMRLERIKVIAEDPTHPELQLIFQRILVDESFHAEAFKNLTTEEELEIAKIDHEVGALQLGLIA